MSAAEKLRRLMEALNLSADELGRLIGRNGSTIRRYLSGEVKLMRSRSLDRIAEVLGCSPDDLLSEEDAPERAVVVGNIEMATMTDDVAPLAARGLILCRVLDDALEEIDIQPNSQVWVDTTVATFENLKAGNVVVVEVSPSWQSETVRLIRQFLPPRLLTTNRNGLNDSFLILNPDAPVTLIGLVLRQNGNGG